VEGRTADATDRLCLPDVDERALEGLELSEALPKRLAVPTSAARLADLNSPTISMLWNVVADYEP
jgi:ATP-dependent Lhr-like helicase